METSDDVKTSAEMALVREWIGREDDSYGDVTRPLGLLHGGATQTIETTPVRITDDAVLTILNSYVTIEGDQEGDRSQILGVSAPEGKLRLTLSGDEDGVAYLPPEEAIELIGDVMAAAERGQINEQSMAAMMEIHKQARFDRSDKIASVGLVNPLARTDDGSLWALSFLSEGDVTNTPHAMRLGTPIHPNGSLFLAARGAEAQEILSRGVSEGSILQVSDGRPFSYLGELDQLPSPERLIEAWDAVKDRVTVRLGAFGPGSLTVEGLGRILRDEFLGDEAAVGIAGPTDGASMKLLSNDNRATLDALRKSPLLVTETNEVVALSPDEGSVRVTPLKSLSILAVGQGKDAWDALGRAGCVETTSVKTALDAMADTDMPVVNATPENMEGQLRRTSEPTPGATGIGEALVAAGAGTRHDPHYDFDVDLPHDDVSLSVEPEALP